MDCDGLDWIGVQWARLDWARCTAQSHLVERCRIASGLLLLLLTLLLAPRLGIGVFAVTHSQQVMLHRPANTQKGRLGLAVVVEKRLNLKGACLDSEL